MNFKKSFALFAAATLFLNIGTHSFAYPGGSNTEMQKIEKEQFSYYRECDRQTGLILEEYDTLFNGVNDTDYVALATSMSMDKSDRILAMDFITQIYSDVDSNEKTYLKSYIESYAPYSGKKELVLFCNKLSAKRFAVRGTYSRLDAKNYALQYYNGTNSSYPNLRYLGGDCANFVSQCLHAGGKSMSGSWYIYKRNSSYPSPKTVKELNSSWTVADPSAWISAKEFNNYWSSNSTTYTYSVQDYKEKHKDIYKENIGIGDVVQLLKPVLWWYEGYHTMIIVGFNGVDSDFIYAAHSRDTNNSSILKNICDDSANSYKNYQIEFFHIN
ncbi:MAG: amidase domain-containing protein [Lachnospiraceae bacterium]|nr:amidase domain-containing protein [Lachnospiraceae bacterium]